MYLTHNEGQSVSDERFIKTLKTKTYKQMTATNSKSCLSYLNKLVDQYNNSYNLSIDKNSINADYSGFTEELETNHKISKFKVIDRVKITK